MLTNKSSYNNLLAIRQVEITAATVNAIHVCVGRLQTTRESRDFEAQLVVAIDLRHKTANNMNIMNNEEDGNTPQMISPSAHNIGIPEIELSSSRRNSKTPTKSKKAFGINGGPLALFRHSESSKSFA